MSRLRRSFLLNLVIIIVLCAVLYVLFFASLHWVTHHGEEVVMPDVREKNLNVAIEELKQFEFEVLVDSTFETSAGPLEVLKQLPDSGSHVKKGRTIFLTVNMLTPPKIPMPNVKDLSYRSAEMILRNNKLLVGDTTYRADIASGAILEASCDGKLLEPGQKIYQGSKIDLVIGNGLGKTEWDVPNVCGMTVMEAMIYLNQFNLQPIIAAADRMSDIVDTQTAVVVDQRPRELGSAGEHNRINMGDFIDLRIMQNPAPSDIYCNKDNIR